MRPGTAATRLASTIATHSDHEHLADRHGRARDGVDVAGEQVPEPTAEGDPDRDPDDDPDERGDRRLPGDRDSQLAAREAEGLQ